MQLENLCTDLGIPQFIPQLSEWRDCLLRDNAAILQVLLTAKDAEHQAAIDSLRALEQPQPPGAVSKLKLLRALDFMHLYDSFIGFLDADPKTREFWTAAQYLMTDDPLLQASIPGFMAMANLSDSDVLRLFESCLD